MSKSRKSCHFLRMLDKKWSHWLGHNLRQLSQAFVANFCLVSFPFFFENFRFCLRVVGRLGERFQTELSREGMTIGWPKNVDELEARISKIIRSIPKKWFRKAFSSLPNRWRKCVQLKGKMTDYYTPKNT